MSEIPAIDHDVPLPSPPGWAAPLLRAMAPGDSCVLEAKGRVNTVYAQASRTGCKVTYRTLPKDKGFRVWLVSRKEKEAAR